MISFRKLFFVAASVMTCTMFNAQVTGINTVPGSFPTLTAAVAALNSGGVGAGGATINVAAGYTETLSGPLQLSFVTNAPSAGSSLIIQKSGAGANPLITAPTGISTTLDGIVVLVGADYVTFDGIDLQENAANTTATTQMEWGYALVKGSATNGSQYNTIKNCTVTLTTANTSSVGIYLGNHTAISTAALVVTSFAGTSSNNKFYNNTVQSAYNGYSLTGYTSAAPFDFYDQNNEIGKDGVSTRAARIIGFGGGAASANGVFATNQNALKIFGLGIAGGTGTTSGTYGIQLLTGTNSSVDIYSDSVTISSLATGGQVFGIQNGMGGTGAGSIINIHDNIVTGCTATALTTGEFRAIGSSSTGSYVNIYNNTITNNIATINGSGAYNGILASGSSATLMLAENIYNNTITGNQNIGTGSTMMSLIYANGSTFVTNCYGNTITNNSNANSTGATYGYYNFAIGVAENVYNNTVTLLTGGSGETSGLFVQSGSGATNKEIYGNTINNITGNSASATVSAITTQYAFVSNIYKNSIHTITNNTATGVTPAACGIFCGTNNNNQVSVYNNFVSDIKAPSASNTNAVIGIDVLGSTSSYFGVYYNTVNLNASSTGANFGSAAVLCGTNPASIDIRNNILVNTSTAAGTGLTRALVRSSTSVANYNTNSGNNCLYAGTPSATNLIFSDGTNNDQTIQAFRNRVSPREQASFTELVPFVNTAGFDFHLLAASPTQCEAGALPVSGYGTDFDGNARNAGTPDVGADEFGGLMNDIAAPNIVYTLLTNSSVAGTRLCNNFATITDPSGINTTAGTAPRLYYKKSTNANTYNSNTSGTDGWKFVQASNASSPFSFTIDYSLLFGGTGVANGDVIQYFVVAQDMAGTPIVGINSGGFTVQPTSVALTAANFPLNNTINQYTIVAAALSGTINVGPAELITSLTNAGGIFQAINSSSLSGNLTINITGDLTAETGTFALNQWAEEGVGGYSVTIVPSAAVQRNIYGSNGAQALVRLDGADRVTIDGRFGGNGTYLMFRNTANTAPTISMLNDAQNNTIKYTIVESGNTSTSTTLGGAIYIGSTTGLYGNDNNTIDNCEIRDRSDVAATPAIGINCVGNTASMNQYNSNNTISNNNIHDWFLANSAAQFALNVGAGNTAYTVSGNSFYQTSSRTNTVAGAVVRAINFSHSAAVPTNGGNTVTGNFIGGTAPGATGGDMTLTVSGAGVSEAFGGISMITGMIPNTISNNTIRNVDFTTNNPAAAATIWFGINLGQGVHNCTGNTIGSPTTAGNLKIQVLLNGASNAFIAGILAATTNGSYNIQNNSIGSIVISGSTTAGIIPQWIQVQGTPSATTIVSGNTIGSTSAANSIMNNGTSGASVSFAIRCITSTGAPFTISNNTIQNVVDNSAIAGTVDYGILMISTTGQTATMNVNGNTIRDFTSNAASATPAFTCLGISVQGFGGTTHTFNNNLIANLSGVNAGAYQGYVVAVQAQGSSFGATMNQNRIFGVTNSNTGASPGLIGVYITAGQSWTFNNNMISISNGTNTNFVDMAGIISFEAAGATMNANYNSIFLGGSVSGGSGTSICLAAANNANVSFKNNLLYNKRTGGTGAHVAIGNIAGAPATGWNAGRSDYNAFITADTTKIGIWGVTNMNMSTWRSTTSGDAMSIWQTSGTVTSSALYVNTNAGNLHINTSTYPEALGTPVAGISVDYDGDPRSATTPTIGADELACSNIVFAVSTQSNVTCNGGNNGSATVAGTGGNGITFLWTPGGATTATATGLSAGTYTVTVTNICGNTGTVLVNITQPTAITVSPSTTAVSCNGGNNGTATASVSGGTPGYTYSWSSGGTAATETGLAMGTYTVIVTDANTCTTSQTVNVTEPTAVTATTMQNNPTCNSGTNGDAMVMPSGGTPGYTYSWSSGGTGSMEMNLGAGTYSCTITDANGCTNLQTVTLTEPTAITSTTTQNNPTCNGSTNGDAMVMPSGGTPGYTYLWSSGGTGSMEMNLGAGSYTCTITDAAGCTATQSVTLTEPAAVFSNGNVVTNPSTCSGADGAIDIAPNGGNAPYTFAWSNGPTTEDVTGLASGTYSVTITDVNGCTGTTSATLTDPSAPIVTLSLPMDTVCQMQTPAFTLSGETPTGGSWSGTAVSGNTFDPSTAPIGYAVVTYMYTDTNNCSSSAMDSMWVDLCMDAPAMTSASVFDVYPNPNNGEFTIELNSTETADVVVYDAIGEVVLTLKAEPGAQNKIVLNTSGAYLVTVTSPDGERSSKRVVVTK